MNRSPRVALATCAQLPDQDEDGPALIAALADRGVVAAEPVVWDDRAVNWAGYDLVVIRSTWDYSAHRDDFVAWAQGVPCLLNPADIVRWNTHKGYLAELARAGIPVVPTAFLAPGDPVDLPASGEYVVKPAVGAGARDTARYRGEEAAAAQSHVARLHQAGRTAMVQPYLTDIDVHGETSVIYVGGEYSHSIRKAPLLAASGPENDDNREAISARTPSPAELALAELALQAVPGGPAQLLYARVDLLPGPDGSPVLIELELTEPSLFLAHSPGAVDQFAEAIESAADRATEAVSR